MPKLAFSPDPVQHGLMCPYDFHSLDSDGVPQYSSNDVAIYGPPHIYGIDRFHVIQTRETECPMVMDFNMEVECKRSMRPIHRYSRVMRFRATLLALLGMRGEIPEAVLDICKDVDMSHKNAWTMIRKRLLKSRLVKKFHIHIPRIIVLSGGPKLIDCSWCIIQECITEFCMLSESFNRDNRSSRKYFPNLRYVALKLLEKHGATFSDTVEIPLAVVKRKMVAMEEWWQIYSKS